MPIRPRARTYGGERADAFVQQALAKQRSAVKAISVGFHQPKTAFVARLQEFGGGGAPERPYFRQAISRIREGQINPIIRAAIDRESMTVQPDRVGLIGDGAAGLVRSAIDRLTEPPLHPTTVRLKGSSDPLIDHGEMRRGVDWKRVR